MTIRDEALAKIAEAEADAIAFGQEIERRWDNLSEEARTRMTAGLAARRDILAATRAMIETETIE